MKKKINKKMLSNFYRSRLCVIGCPEGEQLHKFPKDPNRRAEWCRILGVYPRTKIVYICGAHFSDCYKFGNRLSKYAVPNTPDSRKSNPQVMAKANSMFHRDPNCEANNKSENVIYVNETLSKPLAGDALHSNDHFQQQSGESADTGGRVEDFEIRRGSTNDMIIKGRFVQTNDYLVVSYTPPRKWTLQQQIKILDEKCIQQLKVIRKLNAQNQRLYKELRTHDKLLPKLRYLQSLNRVLYAQLKMYKLKEKERRKRTKEKRLNK